MQQKQTKKIKRYLQQKEVLLHGTAIVWFGICKDWRDPPNFSLAIPIHDILNFAKLNTDTRYF